MNADGDPLTVRKFGVHLPVSDEWAMDECLIPDTRPPRPPEPWWRRLHRWIAQRVWAWRFRLGCRVAGVDLGDWDEDR